MKIKKLTILALASLIGVPYLMAQQPKKITSDSTVVATPSTSDTSNRNVMLSATSNTSPRDVNIGLPAAGGGMNVFENGLPVTFTLWPEIPTRLWRQDATLNGFKLQNLTNTAITNGGVGFTVETTNNLGTDRVKGNLMLKSNHFGLLNGSLNISGPITENGLQFSIGAYANYDPGFFDTDVAKYYADQTQLYKIALSQKYKIDGKSGRIAIFYKYGNSGGSYGGGCQNPFEYQQGGKVKEVNGLTIGRTPFFERSGKYTYLNPFTKEVEEVDWIDYAKNKTHTIDIIGNNDLGNRWSVNYTLRYHQGTARIFSPQTGQGSLVSTLEATGRAKNWIYHDNKSEAYTGEYVIPTNYRGYGGDIKNYAAIATFSKRAGNHNWKIGISEQHYKLDDYFAGTTISYMSLEENPRKLIPTGGQMAAIMDKYGNVEPYYNGGLAYFEGWENKLSAFFSDTWKASSRLTLNYGARLEWKSNSGTCAQGNSRFQREGTTPGAIAMPDKIKGGTVIDRDNLTGISDSYLNKTLQANAVFNITRTFGLLGDIGYNEVAPQLENYAGVQKVDPKQAKIPSGGLGVFFNHPMINVVSKATYIKRDNYIARITEKNPNAPTESETTTVNYDIETMGWTTDILAKPFKGFQLHFLITLQTPKYKDYKGSFNFTTGGKTDFDFSDKTVAGISKVLMEIDPSYSFNKFKVWASARYFSKEYVNIANTIYYKSHWETFAGVEYVVKRGLKFGVNVVNPLNQLGAKGAVQEMDLYTEDQMNIWLNKEKVVLSGSTIRPFTVEFTAAYRF